MTLTWLTVTPPHRPHLEQVWAALGMVQGQRLVYSHGTSHSLAHAPRSDVLDTSVPGRVSLLGQMFSENQTY